MIKKLIIFLLLLFIVSLPALVYPKTDDFISFIDKFAQQPFLLEERKDSFVYNLSSTELRTLRNTVFARHGYIFDSKDLESFFSSRKWYKPVTKNVELSEMEPLGSSLAA